MEVPPWCPDELAHAGDEHLDPGFVAGYDQKQGWPDVTGDLEVLTDRGALHDTATVVDLGTGTGRFALAAAAHCRRVVAVDVSEVMLAHLRREIAHSGPTNVECVQAGFLTYAHRGAPADAVFCRNALHQLPDFFKGIALDRIARILRPGGVLRLHDLVYDFSPADAPTVLEMWMANAATDPTSGYTREDFATHVRTEFSTYRCLLDSLLHATGFDIVEADVRRQIYATYTCMRR